MTRIMYTPDERYIVTGAMDGSVRIWTHVFKEMRAIPAIHEHVRFNQVPLEKCPRPKWKFGAVTALDVSLDSVSGLFCSDFVYCATFSVSNTIRLADSGL
jgi:WD40 repeat protein